MQRGENSTGHFKAQVTHNELSFVQTSYVQERPGAPEDGPVPLLTVGDGVGPRDLGTDAVSYHDHDHDHVRLNQCLMSTKQKLGGHNTDG